MKKSLKIVGVIAGVMGAISLIGLGYIYIKEIASNLVVVKKKIFPNG